MFTLNRARNFKRNVDDFFPLTLNFTSSRRLLSNSLPKAIATQHEESVKVVFIIKR